MSYAAEQQGVPHPMVDSAAVRNYLTHLAVRQHVPASTQNQAFSAILFLCREILGVRVEDVSATTRARRGTHLPVVLSMPETAALLNAMRGTARLMATLIYGGGLRVSECCELRIKDLDFDQGLVYVRSGKGNKDRSTLLPETGRDELRGQSCRAERLGDSRNHADPMASRNGRKVGFGGRPGSREDVAPRDVIAPSDVHADVPAAVDNRGTPAYIWK